MIETLKFRDQYHCQQQTIIHLSLLLFISFLAILLNLFFFSTKNSKSKARLFVRDRDFKKNWQKSQNQEFSKPKCHNLLCSIMVLCWTLDHLSYKMKRYASSWRLSLESCFRDKSSYLDSNMNAFESFVLTAAWYITYKTARDCYTFWGCFILQNYFWPNLQNHFL